MPASDVATRIIFPQTDLASKSLFKALFVLRARSIDIGDVKEDMEWEKGAC
jgi:hypothetical protein